MAQASTSRSQYRSKAVRLSQVLLRDINEGRFGHQPSLPPAQELAPQYDVSHPTMRRALDLLTRWHPGLIGRSDRPTAALVAPGHPAALRQVAFVTPALTADAEIYIRSISEGLDSQRLTLATYSAHANLQKYLQMIEDVVRLRPAGIILTTISPDLGEIPGKLLAESQIPVVVTGPHPIEGLSCDRVDSNGRLSGVVLARHMRRRGYRDVAVLLSSPRRDGQRLVESLRRELAPGGIEIPDEKIIIYEPTRGYQERPDPFIDSQEAVARLLEQGFRCEVLCCGHDYPAVGALRAILATGLRVPQDIKVVSDSRCAVEGVSPMKLTTIDHHSEAQGRIAAELLSRRIDGFQGPIEVHYAPVSLIEGETE